MPVSDDFRRWAVVGLLFLGMVVSYMDRGNISIAAVPLMREFGFSTAQTGLLMSMFFWTYALFQIPAGHLIDRFGVRRIYAFAFVLWCIATAAMGLARSFGELAILRLLLGAGEAVSPLASMAYIKNNFDEREQGLPTAIYVAGLTLGPAAGAVAGTWLLDTSGWRSMFLITGLAGCFWVVPWCMLVPESRSPRPGAADRPAGSASLRGFLNTRMAWGLAASVFFYSYYWYFVLSWIPTYLVLKHDMANVRMGMTMAAPLVGMALVNLCSGALADRITRRQGDAIRVRKLFVSAGFISASLLVLLAWVEEGGPVLPVLVVSLMGVGIAAGNYWALSQAAAPGDLIGRALGFQNMIAQVAGAVAPLVTGLLLGPAQDFRTGILVAGVCPLISVAAMVVLVRPAAPGAAENEKSSWLKSAVP
jgi:MFS transporter, ACS family, D-galactonate transporter